MDLRDDLLIEIGTEELPPKALKSLAAAFAQELGEGLNAAGIGAQSIKYYATPRRLAVYCQQLPLTQASRVVERRGPALAAAFDASGAPTKAAIGFAQSCGVEVAQLQRLETDKGAWLCYRSEEAGQTAAALIPERVEAALKALPVPKRMRWGSGETEFVRPVHWVVALLGEQVLDCEILGLHAGRITYGHRFHHPQPITLQTPGEYVRVLAERGYVQADFEARCALIKEQVSAAAQALNGYALQDQALLEEVAALVEWPVVVTGHFEPHFLEVPQEALISTMQGNQKYFPVVDEHGALMAHFITVSNIASHDPQQVREGNERVIRPRLADARFFWQQDRRHALAERIDSLRSVTFQQKLGSLHDKSERVAKLCSHLAETLKINPSDALRAARLAKCDLQTQMVHEFPELQGIMGRYYAQHDGEPSQVSQALEQHYWPRHAGDQLPQSPLAQALAISDRLDTLVGIFALGQRPTGTKDPFGLRRAALGVLRILIEGRLALDLQTLLQRAAAELEPRVPASAAIPELFAYMMERLRAYYLDRGIRLEVFEAVLALGPTVPLDFDQRVHAVSQFLELPEAQSLAAAHKRIHNILKKTEGSPPRTIELLYLHEAAEQQLHQALERVAAVASPHFARGEYVQGLTALAALREPVDAFFEQVMVMADDLKVRNNRLALLAQLNDTFSQAADLSRL